MSQLPWDPGQGAARLEFPLRREVLMTGTWLHGDIAGTSWKGWAFGGAWGPFRGPRGWFPVEPLLPVPPPPPPDPPLSGADPEIQSRALARGDWGARNVS